MKVLRPFLALYARYWFRISLGMILAIATLFASISLLSISGWFLAASALAGLAGLETFNYMLPAAGLRASAIVRTAARYAERLVSHDTTFRILTQLRVFAFKKLMPLSPGGIARFRQADLLNRLVADIDTLDHLYLRLFSPLISAFVIILIVTFGLSWFDSGIALTLCAIMLALLFIVPITFYRAGKPIGVDLTVLRSDYRTQLNAWLQGQSELSIFGALSRFRYTLDSIEIRWFERQQQQNSLGGVSQALMALASGLTLTLILWLAASGVGEYSQPGALIALFMFASLASFEVLAPVADAFQHLGHVMASAERVNEIVSQPAEVTFPVNGGQVSSAATLSINKLNFSYPNQPLPTLNDINLQLYAGEHIALLGRTGCGKSTLLQLLTRAWNPQSGSILLNGLAIESYSEEALRSSISVVTQRAHIFSATLRQNLLIASANAQDNELETILIQVGLEQLLEDQGLNAWLGEGGRQISGGEQCRIGVARALLHHAPLILLDEPTEGLDNETEQQILSLLEQYGKNKTVIMVTHRLTGLDRLDRICVMDDGKIVEQGTHRELLELGGRYHYFCRQTF